MYKCAICEKQCKNLQSLSSHITFRHKEFAKEQFYQNAISVWTHRDIQKYKYIKKNKLNYIIFWNIDEALNWIGSQVACRYLVELTN